MLVSKYLVSHITHVCTHTQIHWFWTHFHFLKEYLKTIDKVNNLTFIFLPQYVAHHMETSNISNSEVIIEVSWQDSWEWDWRIKYRAILSLQMDSGPLCLCVFFWNSFACWSAILTSGHRGQNHYTVKHSLHILCM